MNMNKQIATIIATAAILSAPAWAQDAEFGSKADTTASGSAAPSESAVVGEGASIEEVSKALAEEIAPAKTAWECIQNYFAAKEGWTTGYDEEKNRIVVMERVDFDVRDPNVSTMFLEQRTEKMQELLIKAKAKIIETIMSKMSAERMLEVPGNPISKQLEQQEKEINAQLQDSREQLEALGAELAEARGDKTGKLSPSELVAVISDWFTKSEKENLAQKFDADKKERYESAKAAFAQAKAEYKELVRQAETLKGTVSKELKTGISKVAAMPIYGCTVLQQAESCVEKNGKYRYQIAIVYYWSMEMQKAAGRILSGESMAFAPGKKTVKEWLAGKAKSGAISEWIGPRQFIDSNGHMWFLGIAAAPCDDDADKEEANREAAELEAAAEVGYALYSDVVSSRELNKLAQAKVLADGTKEEIILKDYSKKQREAFRDIRLAGNASLFSNTVRHRPSGLDIQVVVYGIDSSSPTALKAIQAATVAQGIKVNTYQQMEAGRQQRLHDAFEASKNNPSARALGAAAANAEIKAEAEKLAPARKAAPAATTAPAATSTGGAKSGRLSEGASIIVDDDDEADF